MTTRDIQSHVQEFYGLDVSASLISQITDKVIDLAKEWHNRPLESIYPIVFFDARKLSSGVYIYTIQAGAFVQSQKMLLLR